MPITDTAVLNYWKYTRAFTETFVTVDPTSKSWFYSVVAEDAAGNRSAPQLIETAGGPLSLGMLCDAGDTIGKKTGINPLFPAPPPAILSMDR